MINGSVGAGTTWKSTEIAEQVNLTVPTAAKIKTPKYIQRKLFFTAETRITCANFFSVQFIST